MLCWYSRISHFFFTRKSRFSEAIARAAGAGQAPELAEEVKKRVELVIEAKQEELQGGAEKNTFARHPRRASCCCRCCFWYKIWVYIIVIFGRGKGRKKRWGWNVRKDHATSRGVRMCSSIFGLVTGYAAYCNHQQPAHAAAFICYTDDLKRLFSRPIFRIYLRPLRSFSKRAAPSPNPPNNQTSQPKSQPTNPPYLLPYIDYPQTPKNPAKLTRPHHPPTTFGAHSPGGHALLRRGTAGARAHAAERLHGGWGPAEVGVGGASDLEEDLV